MGSPERSAAEVRRRLQWLMLVRAVTVTVLLGGAALVQIWQDQPLDSATLLALYLLIGFTYFLTIAYAFLINNLRSPQPLAYVQLAGDVAFVTILLYVTGGMNSPFPWAYILPVFAASILLGRRDAVLTAAVSAGIYVALIVLSQVRVLTPFYDVASGGLPAHAWWDVAQNGLLYVCAFFLAALVSGYLSEQARVTGERLRAVEIDYGRLAEVNTRLARDVTALGDLLEKKDADYERLQELNLRISDEVERTAELLRLTETGYAQMDALNKSIVQSLPSGLVTCDVRGHVTQMNRRAEIATGVPRTQAMRRPLTDVLPALAPHTRLTEGVLAFRQAEFEIEWVHGGDGRRRILAFTVSDLGGPADRHNGYILNFQDLTKLREMEERVRLEAEMAATAHRQRLLEAQGVRLESLIGESAKMRDIAALVRRVAATEATILIVGESGTGKELVAQEMHRQSLRKDGPFVPINLSAIPETLLESELFGHMKGSFTGATADKMGLFEVARGGTLFLDEIGELSLAAQVKLLRVIQEKSYRKVGGTQDHALDVRLICATNKDLKEEVRRGRFREDLYYRLNVIQVDVAPLRERREDVVALAHHFLTKYAMSMGTEVEGISSEAMKILRDYDYPGNVRELENIIERGVALETSSLLMPDSLPDALKEPAPLPAAGHGAALPPQGLHLDGFMDQVERDLLLQALERTKGVKKKAADLLQITFRSFRYRLAKHGLDGEEEAGAEM